MTEVAPTFKRPSRAPSQFEVPPDHFRTPGPTGELNDFQILMRRWSQLHPYSAGQVMKISGTPDRDRWKAAIEKVIHETNLGFPAHWDPKLRIPRGQVVAAASIVSPKY